MRFEIDLMSVKELLLNQLSNMFGLNEGDREVWAQIMPGALAKVEENFKHSDNKYYNREGECYFNPFHSGQYCIFLYYISYEIAHLDRSNKNNLKLADKVYYLNKIMNSVDLFYEIELPAHFGVEHPLGSVMGRAKYGDNFFFYQGCTVGGNHHIYPTIGDNVKMCANTTILGASLIGNNVTLGAGALIKDQDVPDNVNVFGQSPNLIFKPKKC